MPKTFSDLVAQVQVEELYSQESQESCEFPPHPGQEEFEESIESLDEWSDALESEEPDDFYAEVEEYYYDDQPEWV